MKQVYEKLIADFCKLTGVTDPAQIEGLGKGNAVEIDGIGFTLAYSEKEAPDRVMIFCDYGDVPAGKEAEAYRALLEANLLTYSNDSAVFSAMPGSGRILCATRFALEGLKADELRGILGFISEQAREWRRTHFDTSIPNSTGSTASRTSAMARNLASQIKPR